MTHSNYYANWIDAAEAWAAQVRRYGALAHTWVAGVRHRASDSSVKALSAMIADERRKYELSGEVVERPLAWSLDWDQPTIELVRSGAGWQVSITPEPTDGGPKMTGLRYRWA